jgi:hypothetical protein
MKGELKVERFFGNKPKPKPTFLGKTETDFEKPKPKPKTEIIRFYATFIDIRGV